MAVLLTEALLQDGSLSQEDALEHPLHKQKNKQIMRIYISDGKEDKALWNHELACISAAKVW